MASEQRQRMLLAGSGGVAAPSGKKDLGRISRLPRWMHRTYALLGAYFWAPCQMCGRKFGGHEWRDINGLSSAVVVGYKRERINAYCTLTRSVGICPACTRAGLGNA